MYVTNQKFEVFCGSFPPSETTTYSTYTFLVLQWNRMALLRGSSFFIDNHGGILQPFPPLAAPVNPEDFARHSEHHQPNTARKSRHHSS